MNDYNDGKWHGWNGGECPVHPKSVVDARFLDPRQHFTPPEPRKAEELIWVHDGYPWDIIAFRVVKPYTEPRKSRERWMDPESGYTAENKNVWSSDMHHKLILLREVME